MSAIYITGAENPRRARGCRLIRGPERERSELAIQPSPISRSALVGAGSCHTRPELAVRQGHAYRRTLRHRARVPQDDLTLAVPAHGIAAAEDSQRAETS